MAPLFIFTGARWCDSLGTGLASMMELCSQIFTALQSPELVARFQKFCGVEGHDTLPEPKKKKEPRSVSKSCPQVDDQNNCAKCVSHSQFDLKLNKIMNELNGVGAVDVVQNGKVVTDSASVLTKRHPENERTLTVRTPCTHLNENGLVHRNGYQKLSRDTGSDAEPDDTEDCAKDKELTHGELTTDVTNILEPEHWTNSEYDYSVKHKSLYYLFKMASAVGNETFFTIFFPYVIWNVDSNIGRQMSVVWFYIMYVGQATKDMIKLPRPASPPVVRLEKRYEYEYGMPSTHAMIGAAFPFGLLTLMQWRYPGEFWFGCSFAVAVVWMLLVATSRLYMGMHTVMDVLAGLLFTGVVLPPLLPVLGYIDQFSVTTWFSPLVVIPVTVTMCLCYPRLDRWSTTRGDTTVVMSTSIGVLMATWLDFQLGRYHDWETPPPYHFSGFDREQFLLGLLRFFLGSVIVALTRMVLKPIVIRGVCAATGTDPTDVKAMQQLRVELPYKYISYCGLAFVAIFISNNIFLSLGITRPTYFTEIL